MSKGWLGEVGDRQDRPVLTRHADRRIAVDSHHPPRQPWYADRRRTPITRVEWVHRRTHSGGQLADGTGERALCGMSGPHQAEPPAAGDLRGAVRSAGGASLAGPGREVTSAGMPREGITGRPCLGKPDCGVGWGDRWLALDLVASELRR